MAGLVAGQSVSAAEGIADGLLVPVSAGARASLRGKNCCAVCVAGVLAIVLSITITILVAWVLTAIFYEVQIDTSDPKDTGQNLVSAGESLTAAAEQDVERIAQAAATIYRS